MNYTSYFATGGKASNLKVMEGIAQLLGLDSEQAANLGKIGLQKYGSEENLIAAMDEATRNLPKDASREDLANAIMPIFQESQMFKCGGKLQQLAAKFGKGGDCGCVKKGAEGFPVGQTPNQARRYAKKTPYKFPDQGRVEDRRLGFATDVNGGKYIFENAVVGGNSANTMIEVPVPGDTLVNQNIQTRTGLVKKIYQPNSAEYESVMQRVRPLFKYFEVPALQEGGSTPDVDLNGRQMRGLANLDRDFDRGQANRAYGTAKKALKNNSDLRGKELRNQARLMVSGIQETPQILVDTPETIKTVVVGPKRYEEAIVTSGNPMETVIKSKASTVKPVVTKSVVTEPVGVNGKNPKTDAWYQYQYERALYDQANGNYRPNQDSAAYQHWMWKDFNDAGDNNTNSVKRDFLMRSPSKDELVALRDAGKFTHGVLPWSRADREAYGVDFNNRMFYFDDAQAKGIPATSNLYNGLAGVMGTVITAPIVAKTAGGNNGLGAFREGMPLHKCGGKMKSKSVASKLKCGGKPKKKKC